MEGEIVLINTPPTETAPGDHRGVLETLRDKVDALLVKFQELVRERNELAKALATEKETAKKLERKLEIVSQDKEKVKSRIDQLLSRLSRMDT